MIKDLFINGLLRVSGFSELQDRMNAVLAKIEKQEKCTSDDFITAQRYAEEMRKNKMPKAMVNKFLSDIAVLIELSGKDDGHEAD